MTVHDQIESYPQRARLTIADFDLLCRSGAFDHYAKTELLDGEIFVMNAQQRPHARIKTRLLIALAEALRVKGSHLFPIVEGGVAMPEGNVPEPDIVLTSAAEGEGWIPLDSVALVIEVSDSSLSHDLGRKARLYAGKAVPEYWVVDVKRGCVHQMWSPVGDSFAERREVKFGETIAAINVPDLAIALEL